MCEHVRARARARAHKRACVRVYTCHLTNRWLPNAAGACPAGITWILFACRFMPSSQGRALLAHQFAWISRKIQAIRVYRWRTPVRMNCVTPQLAHFKWILNAIIFVHGILHAAKMTRVEVRNQGLINLLFIYAIVISHVAQRRWIWNLHFVACYLDVLNTLAHFLFYTPRKLLQFNFFRNERTS